MNALRNLFKAAFYASLVLIVSFAALVSIARADSPAPADGDYLAYFLRADLNYAVGFNCSSEQECLLRCGGSRSCMKPVGACLDCIGARAPLLIDLYQNVGSSILSCTQQPLPADFFAGIFRSLELIPLWSSSAYNPLSLKDASLEARFRGLCPNGDTTVLAWVDRNTRALQGIPMVQCGQGSSAVIYPLATLTEDCMQKSDELVASLISSIMDQDREEADSRAARALGDAISLQYETIVLSDYREAQYIRCDQDSRAICREVCGSALSCFVPLDGERNAKGVLRFGAAKWKTCERETFSVDGLLRYLATDNTFAFSSASLAQRYDIDPSSTGDYTDLSIIDRILADFRGIFRAEGRWSSEEYKSFLVSANYREAISREMQKFCAEGETPFIMGTANEVERVFCRKGANGYFQALSQEDKACPAPRGVK